MAKLVLVRHGKSEYNVKGLWTGWTDVPLNEAGREEAANAAKELTDIKFDHAFASALVRAQETLKIILENIHEENIPTTFNKELNERSYGDYTGKNKWQVKEEVGEEEFQKIRRSWDESPPNGESLKDVYERVIPYYEQNILPLLKEGKNVIVAAHGNSLRALVKYLDDLSVEEVQKLEIATGGVYVYDIDSEGKVTHKEIRGNKVNTV